MAIQDENEKMNMFPKLFNNSEDKLYNVIDRWYMWRHLV